MALTPGRISFRVFRSCEPHPSLALGPCFRAKYATGLEPGKSSSWPSNLSNLEEERARLIVIGRKLGIKEGDFSAWYRVSNRSLIEMGGRSILTKHSSSISTALKEIFPEHFWDVTQFASKPKNFWSENSNQRTFLVALGNKLGIQEGNFEPWYNIDVVTVEKFGGKYLLAKHGSSLPRLLEAVFPEHSWDPSKFSNKPKNFWSSNENQLVLVKEISGKLGFNADTPLEEWYNVTHEDFIKHGGRYLLNLHNSSLADLLVALFPEHPWDPNRFRSRTVLKSNLGSQETLSILASKPSPPVSASPLPKLVFSEKNKNSWTSIENQRDFVKDLGKKLGLEENDREGWYQVTRDDFFEHGGGYLLGLYGSSVATTLRAIFPEHKWDLGKFWRKPIKYWSNSDNIRDFLLEIGRKIPIREGEWQKWYSVRTVDLLKFGGKSALRQFGSVGAIVTAAFPEHKWDLWRFSQSPTQLSRDLDALRSAVSFAETQLKLKAKEDWLKVSDEELFDFGLRSVVTSVGGTTQLLKRVYPDFSWESHGS